MNESEKNRIETNPADEGNKTTINIFGACVSRDMFPKDTDFEIHQYVSFSSPMSLFLPKNKTVLKEADLSGLTWGSNFAKRCLLLDHNHQGLNYLFQYPSDWLLLDFADIRLKLVKYGDKNYISLTNLILQNEAQFRQLFGDYEILPVFPLEENKKAITWLCHTILQHYAPEQIILHEYYLVDTYVAKDGNIRTFRMKADYQTINALLKELYTIAEDLLKGCYIIRMPRYVLADEKHIWGCHPLHYMKAYYDYAYQALTHIICTSSAPPENLLKQCEDNFFDCNIRITMQPENVTISETQKVSFSVKSAVAPVSYQWYYTKGDTVWRKVRNNGTSATYTTIGSASRNGWQFRCEVSNGRTKKRSDTATITYIEPTQ